VNVGLKRINSGHAIVGWPMMPCPASRRLQATASAAPTKTFLGSQPRSAHVPPQRPRLHHGDRPSLSAAARGHRHGRLPITIKSKPAELV